MLLAISGILDHNTCERLQATVRCRGLLFWLLGCPGKDYGLSWSIKAYFCNLKASGLA